MQHSNISDNGHLNVTKGQIIVDFNNDDYKFIIYDRNKSLIGSFSSLNLIKYATSKITPLFLSYTDNTLCAPVIETYVCKVVEDDESIKINLLNQLQSPFMGSLDMIIKLYQGIHEFEKKSLDVELSKITDPKIEKKLSAMIKQLTYLLLNYSLKLIATISDSIKTDDTKSELKEALVKYSVAIVYRLNNLMKHEIEDRMKDYSSLQSDLLRMATVKVEMYKKINELNSSVVSQNKQISDIVSKLDNLSKIQPTYYGGSAKSSSSKSSSSDSSSSSSKQSSSESKDSKSKSESSAYISSKGSTTSATKTDTGTESGSGSESDRSGLYNLSSSNLISMFNDSDCYFTESGNDAGHISYLTSSSSKPKEVVSSSSKPKEVVSSGKPKEVVSGGKVKEVVSSGKVKEVVSSGKPKEVVSSGKAKKDMSLTSPKLE
jgi:hypothetical protein